MLHENKIYHIINTLLNFSVFIKIILCRIPVQQLYFMLYNKYNLLNIFFISLFGVEVF